jgi:hypothetical protein
MGINKIDGRIRIKRSTTALEAPTLPPSTDHTDGTWTKTDIYDGEFFVNTSDGKLYLNTGGVIKGLLFDDVSPGLTGRVIVNQSNFNSTICGTIDSTKEYFIDGIVDIGASQITIPQTGVSIKGYSFDLSGLVSSENNYTMFISETIGDTTGSGNVLMTDILLTTSGTSSKVYDINDITGFNAIELNRVNYINCTSLGIIDRYRQGLELGTGRFGGSPTLELKGNWVGGFRITTSIVRSLSSGMTTPLFKEGTSFTMNSRFLTDINCDLPTSAAFTDFQVSNFPNESTIQFKGAIITRNGVVDSTDTNIIPNISVGAKESEFKDNVGIPNTYAGGILEVTTELETTINTIDVWEDLTAPTWTGDILQHFETTATSGELKHVGINPIEFNLLSDVTVEGGANDVLELRFNVYDDSAATWIPFNGQVRVVNNLVGGSDLAFFGINKAITLNQNDLIKMQVRNTTDTTNITVKLNSFFRITER